MAHIIGDICITPKNTVLKPQILSCMREDVKSMQKQIYDVEEIQKRINEAAKVRARLDDETKRRYENIKHINFVG